MVRGKSAERATERVVQKQREQQGKCREDAERVLQKERLERESHCASVVLR